jgi:hypothetical protein
MVLVYLLKDAVYSHYSFCFKIQNIKRERDGLAQWFLDRVGN